MPLYEYECDACGERFEVIQKFSETTEQCRRCGKGPVRRLMSSPAIQFKGSGFYITDYPKTGKSGGESSTGSGSSAEKKGDSTKSDSAKSDTSPKSDTPAASSTSSSTTDSSKKD
jgi:putative FmdB family regulatory protein